MEKPSLQLANLNAGPPSPVFHCSSAFWARAFILPNILPELLLVPWTKAICTAFVVSYYSKKNHFQDTFWVLNFFKCVRSSKQHIFVWALYGTSNSNLTSVFSGVSVSPHGPWVEQGSIILSVSKLPYICICLILQIGNSVTSPLLKGSKWFYFFKGNQAFLKWASEVAGAPLDDKRKAMVECGWCR